MTVDIRTGLPFPRGARRSPMHKTLEAPQHRPIGAPTQFGFVPPQTDMWDNDHDGDCVTAQEAWAKAWWSVRCGLPELFVPTAEVIRWASKYGFLNGANLTDVMDKMSADGFTINGQNYKDGPYASVNYTSWDTLASALANVGCINIAIDANALPAGAGNQTGWYALSKGNYPNTDHCVGLGAFGPASFCYDLMKVAVPSAVGATVPGLILYTWNTHGFVTLDWLAGTCTEAWTRNPTTPGQLPGPTPGPGPGPGPQPGPTPVGPGTITLNFPAFTVQGIITGGPSPPVPVPQDALGLLIQALGEMLANFTDPRGWNDFVKAIEMMLGFARALGSQSTSSSILLQIIDGIITAVGQQFGLPSWVMDALVQIVNSLFGGQRAAAFAAQHASLRRPS